MSKTALLQILDRWTGVHVCDPDTSLLGRFLTSRDEDAFTALVQRHGPLVFATCLRILGHRDESEDAFQAVFFVLARRAHTLKREGSIGPWLHGVSVRVAMKLRGQIVRRRLRELSAVKSEHVPASEPNDDFWAVIDEELTRLPLPLREVLLLCDLSGKSHAQAAESLGVAKGTITKRLARAREELASRLRRRGITLGVAALSTWFATQAPASVSPPLLQETARQAILFSIRKSVDSTLAKSLAESVMRSFQLGAVPVWFMVGLLGLVLSGAGWMFANEPGDPAPPTSEPPQAPVVARADTPKVGTMWKENFTIEYSDSLPVSVAFAADGKTLLTGDTKGEVMALIFTGDEPQYRWKTKVGGAHAAVAYSPDQKTVYATTEHGVRVLEAAVGKEVAYLEEKNSNPLVIKVFPSRTIAETFTQSQIVFGDARGYFIKSWVDGKLAETLGTIETRIVAKGAKPSDLTAVPLAVDPMGRSAIMTGPLNPQTKKNVLWAYVCGNYDKGSPGNRLMEGHTAAVVSAAWAKNGRIAVTGDADGRVIVWDAGAMKETQRIELGGRIMALAISDQGTHLAAYVHGKQRAEVSVWETAKPPEARKQIHSQQADLGSEPHASLTFSSDGKRLAGCAISKTWSPSDPKTVPGRKVHIWDLADEPKDQSPPKLLYSKPLPQGLSSNFVLVDNHSILMPADKQGAVDFRSIRDGGIQFRIGLGNFSIGRIKLSSDRKWLALEQHPPREPMGVPQRTFDVGVYQSHVIHKATIPSCRRLLDVASGGTVVAVVREKQIEIWDINTVKILKESPFQHTSIDACVFSPDGKLLALSDQNTLVLWRWEQNTQERIDLGRSVGSLAFSPDGKFLAEGPTPRESILIRDVDTRQIVQTLSPGTKLSMNVPRMAYTQGGRVLIACDTISHSKDIKNPHRLRFWDTLNGSLAHQIALPNSLPTSIDVTPNGRYLAAILEDDKMGKSLTAWRLSGDPPGAEQGPRSPAAVKPE